MINPPIDPNQNRRALVLLKSGIAHLKVGGLGLVERWLKALAAYHPSLLEASQPEINRVLSEPVSSKLVVDGSAVFDDDSIEQITSTDCGDAEIVGFKGKQVPLAPVLLMGATAVQKVTQIEAVGWRDLPAALEALSKRSDFTVRIEQLDSLFWVFVSDTQSSKSATWELLKRLRLRAGGFIAKVVNRHISIRITRMLLPFKVTPNMMTTFAGLIGLVSVYLLMLGGYIGGVAGTGIMQLSSILDGVDGEIARIKYQASTFGKYYDSVWDEVNNALFMAAVGYHQYLYYDFLPFLFVGIFTGAVSFFYATVNWHCKYKTGIGLYWWFDSYGAKVQKERRASLKTQWKSLFTRDSYLLVFFLLAVAGFLPPMLIAVGCSSTVVLAMLFIHIVIKRAKW